MYLRSIVFRVSIAISAISLASCSNSTGPTSSNGYPGQGEFSYLLNGRSVQSKSGLLGGGASAALYPLYPGLSSKTLDITLTPTTQSFSYRQLVIVIPVVIPGPKQYAVSTIDDTASNAAAFYYQDSLEYDSKPGGTVTITKFDTVNNLVSGTFSFTTSRTSQTPNPNDTDVFTSGTFTDVPIYVGSYAQGSITASVNAFSFSAGAGQNPLQAVTAWIERGTAGLFVQAVDADSVDQRFLTMLVITPKPGVFVLDTFDFFGSASSATYSNTNYNDPTQNVSIGSSKGHGQIIITKFDSVQHRFSGTFSFSGVDPSSGNIAQITNGVIDNVQWYVL